MRQRFNAGDTVEVTAPSAYHGEVGVVLWTVGHAIYRVHFPSGETAAFAWYELRSSQQKLDLPRGG